MADFTNDVRIEDSHKKGYTEVKFGANSKLLEVELNELQRIQNEARASLVRKQVHSGVLNLGAITTLIDTPNTILVAKQEVNVNGYLIDLPQTNIILPEPPTEGERDDLVFLEAWFEDVNSSKDSSMIDPRVGIETSRRRELKWRIRTVAGVDFKKFPEGFGVKWADSVSKGSNVTPQGGNSEPVDVYEHNYSFKRSDDPAHSKAPNDVGLYFAGTGSQASKDLLKTADGYVYAIPLLRIKRRNSGGYSVNNPNGSQLFAPKTKLKDYVANTFELHVEDTEGYEVGDYLYIGSSYNGVKIVDIDRVNHIFYVNKSWNSSSISGYTIRHDRAQRPDGKFANIIYEDDIIDLRHQVSLTGWNYDKLLEENFDKLLRGELRTKEGQKMLKTYHGIRKTPIDSNTVFYASLDGTTVAEVGGALNLGTGGYFVPHATGLGYMFKKDAKTPINISGLNGNEGTIDFFLDVDTLVNDKHTRASILSLFNNNGYPALMVSFGGGEANSKPNQFRLDVSDTEGNFFNNYVLSEISSLRGINHFRATWNVALGKIAIYINGNKVSEKNTFTGMLTPTQLIIGRGKYNTVDYYGYDLTGAIADVSVSNIDRGENFATLPKDFIDGYARIDKAFNGQRRNFSDAQTSQHTISIAKPKSLVSDRGITVEKGTGTNETIWEEGDQIKVKGLAGEIIDDVSAPTVKASLDGGETTIDVVGTWTGLGTSEATFTLGENENLDTEDVFIEYSLNSPSGQGGIPEVLTEVLEGEYLGQKYVKGAPTLKADFRGKVAGSIVEHPHFFKTGSSTDLQLPNSTNFVESGVELVNGDNIHLLDNKVISTSVNENGKRAQQLFSFDLIAEVERQFGRIPKASKADKVQWLRDNIILVNCKWTGFGSSVGGNSANLRYWSGNNNIYSHSIVNNKSTSPSQSSISHIPKHDVDNNGFAHFIVYAEPSDGVTPSVINTDYVEVEIRFKTPTGYDTLTPTEPFHNGTRKNFFFIRKETKEIEMMFNCDEDYGVITWGNYIPKQFYAPAVAKIVYLSPTATILTSTTAKPHTSSEEKRNLAIAHVPLPPNVSTSYLDGEILSGSYGRHKKVLILNDGIIHPIGSATHVISAALLPDEPEAYRRLAIRYGVVEVNGELLLRIACRVNTSKTTAVNFPISEYAVADYSMVGRPLVKGVN